MGVPLAGPGLAARLTIAMVKMVYHEVMKKTEAIAISEFKAHCLRLVDQVAHDGRTLIITKHGKPMARVSGLRTPSRSLKGSWKGMVTTTGDVVHLDEMESWEDA